MNPHPLLIKELTIQNEELEGVSSISLVDMPAIESNFIYFNNEVQLRQVSVGNGYVVDLDDFWFYTADPEPEIINTSHTFCKSKAGKVHHITEIRSWDKYKSADFNSEPGRFIQSSNFFATFNGVNSFSFNIDEQIYNCRHAFRRVRKLSDIPAYKQTIYKKKTPLNINQSKEEMSEIQFAVDTEKREICGPALIPGKMIYRNRIPGYDQSGYVYISKSTIQKVKDKYGYNRSLTIMHDSNITGKAILLDSWIYPTEKDNNYGLDVPEGTWFLRYKIIDEKLWNVIKERKVLGFSIEGMFSAI